MNPYAQPLGCWMSVALASSKCMLGVAQNTAPCEEAMAMEKVADIIVGTILGEVPSHWDTALAQLSSIAPKIESISFIGFTDEQKDCLLRVVADREVLSLRLLVF